MIGTIAAVARKELVDAFRDRRSLASGFFYGVWGPLVMALAVTAIARDRSTDAPLPVPAERREQAPALTAFLDQRGVTLVDAPPGVRDRIRRRELEVGLVVADDFPDDFAANRPATITVIYDGAWSTSRARAERVKSAVSEYARHVTGTRLVLRGVSPAAVAAIDLEEQDLSTAAGRAGVVVGTLPIFLLVAAFVGGMSVAADATAGERERGSLESLLLYPVPRLAIALGKWLAAATLAVATVSVTVAVSAALLQHPRIQTIDLPIGLSMREAFLVWLLMLPLAWFAPSLQMLIGLFSRTFKEANTNLSLLIFLPMIPGFVFAFGTVQPQAWMTWTPVLGQQLLISALLRGEAPTIAGAAPLVALSLVATGLAIALTAALLNREAMVRRTGS